MASSPPPNTTPAPYGRACANCSHAKSKCFQLAAGTGCERCQRLKKTCRPSTTVRKRNGRASTSKTAQLEAKLDSLMSLLLRDEPSTDTPGLSRLALPTTVPQVPQSREDGSSRTANSDGIPTPPATTALGGSPQALDTLCSSIPISPENAEQMLSFFRTESIKNLPFAYIPSYMTSQQLRQEKPFFWLSIMAVTSPHCLQRESINLKLADFIHQKILIDFAPSMDILLGMMTFFSWATYSGRHQQILYPHVIMGLVCDLGINKPIPTEPSTMQAFKCAVGFKQNTPTSRTMEERRAVLGCYLITASIALTTSKIDALRWTPHMEESLSALTNARECPEDERLVTLVKLSLVMDKAYHLQRDGDGHHAPYFYIKAFQSQLNLVKDSIPGSLRNDDSILFHIATTELVIHEIAMRAPSTPNTPDLQRLDSLYTSLQAAKTWLDLWLSQRPTEYMAFPYTIFGQLSRALVSLYRLSVLDDPAWDRNFVRTTANLLEYLNRMTYGMKMSTTHLAVPHQSEWNVFEKASTMFQCIREGWEPKLIEAWFPSPQSRGFDDTLNASNPPMLDETLPMNGLDDLWMMDVFGSL